MANNLKTRWSLKQIDSMLNCFDNYKNCEFSGSINHDQFRDLVGMRPCVYQWSTFVAVCPTLDIARRLDEILNRKSAPRAIERATIDTTKPPIFEKGLVRVFVGKREIALCHPWTAQYIVNLINEVA